MDDWYKIQARSGDEDVWLGVQGEGKPEVFGEPWLMPDGKTDVYPFLQDWRVSELPFSVWLSPINAGSDYGDMLWTGGLSLKIASSRMIEALEKVRATGYRTFEVDLRDRDNAPIPGYVGFATDPSPQSDIRNIFNQQEQNYVFVVPRRIVDALHAHEADKLDISVYRPE